MAISESVRLMKEKMAKLTDEIENNDICAATGSTREEITQKAKRGEPLSMMEALVVRSTPHSRIAALLEPGMKQLFENFSPDYEGLKIWEESMKCKNMSDRYFESRMELRGFSLDQIARLKMFDEYKDLRRGINKTTGETMDVDEVISYFINKYGPPKYYAGWEDDPYFDDNLWIQLWKEKRNDHKSS
jgi:hypothetical protein